MIHCLCMLQVDGISLQSIHLNPSDKYLIACSLLKQESCELQFWYKLLIIYTVDFEIFEGTLYQVLQMFHKKVLDSHAATHLINIYTVRKMQGQVKSVINIMVSDPLSLF